MNIRRSIKRVASFIRYSSESDEFDRMQRMLELNPKDLGLYDSYIRLGARLNRPEIEDLSFLDDPSIRSNYILACEEQNVEPKLFRKWMKTKYGFSINPEKMEWVIRTHVENFDWMLGLNTPSIIHLLDLRLTIPPSFSLLRNPENLLILNLHGNNYTYLNIFDCPLPSLKDLSFNSNNIHNLEGPLDFPNLTVLRINDNNIDLSSISNLRLPNLDTLQISSNKLSSFKGLEKLEAPKLRKIELDFNRFDTLEGIERLNKFTNLSYIYFIGNASLGSLRGLEKLDIPKKCIIDIEGCQIRKSEIDRFFSSNPKSFLTFIY